MPALGESVTEGTVTTWLKSVGDAVETDEPLVEVSTDKVDSEVPAPASGFLAEIRVPEDETVEVGTVLAVITAQAPSAAPANLLHPLLLQQLLRLRLSKPLFLLPQHLRLLHRLPHAPVNPFPTPASLAQTAETGQLAQSSASTPAQVSQTGYVTPIVRKLAREAGIELAEVTGTGIGGRIRREDVEAAIKARAAVQAPAAPAASAAPQTSRSSSPWRQCLLRPRGITASRNH